MHQLQSVPVPLYFFKRAIKLLSSFLVVAAAAAADVQRTAGRDEKKKLEK